MQAIQSFRPIISTLPFICTATFPSRASHPIPRCVSWSPNPVAFAIFDLDIRPLEYKVSHILPAASPISFSIRSISKHSFCLPKLQFPRNSNADGLVGKIRRYLLFLAKARTLSATVPSAGQYANAQLARPHRCV